MIKLLRNMRLVKFLDSEYESSKSLNANRSMNIMDAINSPIFTSSIGKNKEP